MPDPIKFGAAAIDLSERFFKTATVTGSPAAATETIIATLPIAADLAVMEGVLLIGYAAFTAGTNGVSAGLKIRRTDASGAIQKDSGLVTVTAAALYDRSISAFDTGPSLPNQTYVMTLVITSGSATSTVSAVTLAALVI